MEVRREEPRDRVAVRHVNELAFGSPTEANIVDVLRSDASAISLVADAEGQVVGHITFSPVRVEGAPEVSALALGPMAVLPDRQRTGIGTTLVRAGLEQCRRSGVGAVFVVGYPSYYPRFGFDAAAKSGFSCEFDVPADVFMVVELIPGTLAGRTGTVHFHEAFRNA